MIDLWRRIHPIWNAHGWWMCENWAKNVKFICATPSDKWRYQFKCSALDIQCCVLYFASFAIGMLTKFVLSKQFSKCKAHTNNRWVKRMLISCTQSNARSWIYQRIHNNNQVHPRIVMPILFYLCIKKESNIKIKPFNASTSISGRKIHAFA